MHSTPPWPPTADAMRAQLRIVMHDHPGAVAQVVSLLGRRAFGFETIVSTPGDGGQRWVWLVVPRDERLGQLRRQLEKLEDVDVVTVE